jgi:stage V sporulation protein B
VVKRLFSNTPTLLELINLSKSASKSIIKGTLVLITGNIIVKIIGAFFKLPLANIIGADGMGLYNASFIVFDIFLVLSTAGFPLAVSKMVANCCAHGKPAEALKTFSVARNCFFIIGITFSIIMLFGAKLFSELIGNTRSFYCIIVLSPAVLFVSLMSAYRGYYQGTNDMVPTTISQIIEAICRLVVGLSLSWYLKSAGFDPQIIAAGAMVGITVGEFSSTFALAMIHKFRQRKRKTQLKCTTSTSKIVKTMFSTSTPIGVSIIIISVINMLDNAVVMHRLQDTGLREYQANTLYGTYNMAFTVFALPITIVSALTISIFPIITYAFACGNKKRVTRTAQASLRISMIVAMASTAVFLSLSSPIINLLYFNQPSAAKIAVPLLMLLAPSAIMIALSMLTTIILQATDKLITPSRSMIIGGIACLISNWFLVGNKNFGIYGAPAGIFICYTITSILNIIALNKSKNVKITFRSLFYKPFVPAAVMGATGYITFKITYTVFGLLKASALSLSASFIIYLLVLFFNNTIERDDLLLLPKGYKLVRLLERIHLMQPKAFTSKT